MPEHPLYGILRQICHKESISHSREIGKKDNDMQWGIDLKGPKIKGTRKVYKATHTQPFLAVNIGDYNPSYPQKIIEVNNRNFDCFIGQICDYVLLVEGYAVFVELKSSISKDKEKEKAKRQLFASVFHWNSIERILKCLPDFCDFSNPRLHSEMVAVSFPAQYRFCVLNLMNRDQSFPTDAVEAFRDEVISGFGETKYKILKEKPQFKVSDMIRADGE